MKRIYKETKHHIDGEHYYPIKKVELFYDPENHIPPIVHFWSDTDSENTVDGKWEFLKVVYFNEEAAAIRTAIQKFDEYCEVKQGELVNA